MKENELLFYNRDKILNFMGTDVNDTTFVRMRGFTSGENTSNAETDETKYIDEPSIRKRVTGYSKEIAYEADRIVGNPIHNFLAEVEDLEKTNVNVVIVTVDLNRTKGEGYYAIKRVYSVIPDTSGGDENKYTISGTFGANGDIIEGVAMSNDGLKTITFVEDGEDKKQLVTFNVSSEDGQVQGAKIVIDTNNTIYTDANGIANANLEPNTYSKITISKDSYVAQENISVTVDNKPVYKAISLEK